MTIEAIVAEGDTVAVRILSQGTNLGALNGMLPPTGKRFAACQSHWFRVTTASWPSTGPPARISLRCCSWGVVQPPGRLPS
jgi:SnoaL-like polyketide cyclase